jgi:Protein of unknown function (DUF2934)
LSRALKSEQPVTIGIEFPDYGRCVIRTAPCLENPLRRKDGVCLTQVIQMAKPTEEQIRIRAHELWEEAGKPDGQQDEFWHKAEKDLSQGATSDEKSETFLE